MRKNRLAGWLAGWLGGWVGGWVGAGWWLWVVLLLVGVVAGGVVLTSHPATQPPPR